MKNQFEAVILDVDGTLIDSNHAHACAWKEAIDSEGLRGRYDEIRSLMGMCEDQLIPKLAGVDKNTIRGRKFVKKQAEIFKTKYLADIRPFPRVRDLLLKLQEQGLKLVVASSSKKSDLKQLLQIAEVEDLIDLQISAPDPYQQILTELHLPPDRAVVIGDTPYDLDSAKKSHMAMIAFRCGGWSDNDFVGSLDVYDDPQDLLENLKSSRLRAVETGEQEMPIPTSGRSASDQNDEFLSEESSDESTKIGHTAGTAEGSLETVEEALKDQEFKMSRASNRKVA